jgi:GH15 family glucan-1,4-alpha-glucosidase
MSEHLYSKELGRFIRSIQVNGDDSLAADTTIDASLFGSFYFGCYSPDDEKVVNTMRAIEENLAAGGGIARFQNDSYMRVSDQATGNPWFLCTLWLADYYIAAAKTAEDLGRALEIIEWTADHALPSGVLAEQMNPLTGEPVSVSPLTWSHSTFVATVMNYVQKSQQIQNVKHNKN